MPEFPPARDQPIETSTLSKVVNASGRLIIGLTGGIATGKSTASQYLASLGADILDADVYARQAVEIDSSIWQKIVQHYGTRICLASGQINRAMLGEIIFTQPAERAWLESLIHPYVRDRLRQELATLSRSSAVVMVIPLLFEAGMKDLVNRIWVVYCPPSIQLKRLMSRDHLTLEQAQARIASQMPLAEKMSRADVVLNNSSTPAELCRQIKLTWQTIFPDSKLG